MFHKVLTAGSYLADLFFFLPSAIAITVCRLFQRFRDSEISEIQRCDADDSIMTNNNHVLYSYLPERRYLITISENALTIDH